MSSSVGLEGSTFETKTDPDRRGSLAISALLNEESIDPKDHYPTPTSHQEQTSSLDKPAADYFSQPLPQSPASSASTYFTPLSEQSSAWGYCPTQQPKSSGSIIVSSMAKAKRKRISREQFTRLMEVFEQTDAPSAEMREQIAQELDMTKREVQVWFQNRRAKMNRAKAASSNGSGKAHTTHHYPPAQTSHAANTAYHGIHHGAPYRHHAVAKPRRASRAEPPNVSHAANLPHKSPPVTRMLPTPHTTAMLPQTIPSHPVFDRASSQPAMYVAESPLTSESYPDVSQGISVQTARPIAPKHSAKPLVNHISGKDGIHDTFANLSLQHEPPSLQTSNKRHSSAIDWSTSGPEYFNTDNQGSREQSHTR